MLKKSEKILKFLRNKSENLKNLEDFEKKSQNLKSNFLFHFSSIKITFSRFRGNFILSTPSCLKVMFVICQCSTMYYSTMYNEPTDDSTKNQQPNCEFLNVRYLFLLSQLQNKSTV